MNVDDEALRVRADGDCNTKRELKSYAQRSEHRCERRNTRKKKMELEKRSDNKDERLDFVEDRKMPWLHIAKNFKDRRHLIYNI